MAVRFRYQYNIPFKNDRLASKSKSCLYHFHQNESSDTVGTIATPNAEEGVPTIIDTSLDQALRL